MPAGHGAQPGPCALDSDEQGLEPGEEAPVHRGCVVFLREQARLRASVVEEDTEQWQKDSSFTGLERVGGVDLSYIKGDDSSACASLVVLSYPALEVTLAPKGCVWVWNNVRRL